MQPVLGRELLKTTPSYFVNVCGDPDTCCAIIELINLFQHILTRITVRYTRYVNTSKLLVIYAFPTLFLRVIHARWKISPKVQAHFLLGAT